MFLEGFLPCLKQKREILLRCVFLVAKRTHIFVLLFADIIPYRSDMVLSEGCARFADVFVLPLVGRKSARV